MKTIIVFIIISPILYIGVKNLWLAFFVKKNFCGSCTRCGTGVVKNCSTNSLKK